MWIKISPLVFINTPHIDASQDVVLLGSEGLHLSRKFSVFDVAAESSPLLSESQGGSSLAAYLMSPAEESINWDFILLR